MVKWFLNHECLSLSFCGSAILKALILRPWSNGAISRNSQQEGRRENMEEPYSYICAYRMVNWKKAEKWSPARQPRAQFSFYYQWRKEATSVDSWVLPPQHKFMWFHWNLYALGYQSWAFLITSPHSFRSHPHASVWISHGPRSISYKSISS